MSNQDEDQFGFTEEKSVPIKVETKPVQNQLIQQQQQTPQLPAQKEEKPAEKQEYAPEQPSNKQPTPPTSPKQKVKTEEKPAKPEVDLDASLYHGQNGVSEAKDQSSIEVDSQVNQSVLDSKEEPEKKDIQNPPEFNGSFGEPQFQFSPITNQFAVNPDTPIPMAPNNNPFQKKSNFIRDESGFGNMDFGAPMERGGSSRGRGRGRGRGGFRGGYNRGSDRDYNQGNNFGGNEMYNRGYSNNFGGGRNNYGGSDFGGSQMGRLDNYQQQSFPPYVPSQVSEPTTATSTVKTEKTEKIATEVDNVPNVRFCWPSYGIKCLQKPISIIYRNLESYHKQGSLLVVPFKTEDFEFYGGETICFSQVDYREKIIKKKDQLKAGQCYISGSKGNNYFEKFAFIKIEDNNEIANFKQGIEDLKTFLKEYKHIPRAQIIFAVDDVFGDIYQTFFYVIENYPSQVEGLKFIDFNVSSPECFTKCGESFSKVVMELYRRKQIRIR